MKKIIIAVSLLIGIVLVFTLYRNSEPVDIIEEVREEVAENIQVIDTVITDSGMMIYSFGETNSGNNYMYFVDMLKKSLNGYKWLGGGGHIDEDLSGTNNFSLSLQLLNEEQNVNPILFGIINEPNVSRIEVSTDNELIEAAHYEVINDVFFAIPFSDNVADVVNFQLMITYDDGVSAVHTLSGDKVRRLQDGRALYLNKADFR